ncbi:GNAT family N-acetyltransferase [Litorilituus sediminis]|uniref:GNAT family N-acetyltransferase n=1 Tax=Litorilituus sediminis TaxID=718192 RepID=A0A4V0ZGB5_9GAMM|nr:GNAT family N-acetyltransferase [Litorilituus sediminis]QBG36720.1 GNAT family N-acetyltransferase [Litorilituus sediminis]
MSQSAIELFTILQATKADKKAILRFYKQQHYSARFIGLDHCYFIKHQNIIIACVIVSKLTQDNPQYLMHALFVDKEFRQQSLASQLIQHVTSKHSPLICFAKQALSKLYLINNMRAICDTQAQSSLSTALQLRFNSYKNKEPSLTVFALP